MEKKRRQSETREKACAAFEHLNNHTSDYLKLSNTTELKIFSTKCFNRTKS